MTALCRQHAEALAARCEGEALIQRDEVECRRPFLGGDERGGELECVACSEVMNADQPKRNLAQPLARRDLGPARSKFIKTRACVGSFGGAQLTRSFAPGGGRRALHSGRPPDSDREILAKQLDDDR